MPAKEAQLARGAISPLKPGEEEDAGGSLEIIEDIANPASKSHTDNNLVSPRLASSTPNMFNRGDAASTVSGPSVSNVPSGSGPPSVASGRSATQLVKDRSYRSLNLASHNMRFRKPHEEMPECIIRLINKICQDRTSPEPSLDSIKQDAALTRLEWEGASESEVEGYFVSKMFPALDGNESLRYTKRHPLASHTIPKVAISDYKLATPVPDILYGYNRDVAFSQHTSHLLATGTESIANSQDLLYPFFDIEFRGEDGSLWEGTNQCITGSASCIKMVEALNDRLEESKHYGVQPINSAAFSVTMNGTEARLFIAWKENNEYSMAKVESFLLQSPDHYLNFRKLIRNILDWGKSSRLSEITGVLDAVFGGDGGNREV
ncbi:conserved hypothetical protein [Histoplasma capsulatum var. duboisii H88]|uniref:DUF7924 domain-containing protein n=1 Tax=Ajellomyces capsulatus (strain H88) TaxID=544711 RepID=F0UMC3_AJEC8|nr:conserved hypothetical protein [Histoplasma capsulatum var. duboisii H88]